MQQTPSGAAAPRHREIQRRDGATPYLEDEVALASRWVRPLEQQIGRVLVGQRALVDRLLVALLANGHVLLEGVPGLAKTLSLKALAGAIDLDFKRIQFTPDMLPADVVGTLIYDPRTGDFRTKRGPVFANLVLADEINRAPAKVQSALLEAMQERQVTLGEETHALPDPFLVMATQNPVEQEGTYALPEAQVDRFMLKVVVGYPSRDEERAIVSAMANNTPRLGVDRVVSIDDVMAARAVVDRVYVDERVRDYAVDVVGATREPAAFGLDIGPLVRCGASPRASIALTLASKARALLEGRAYVTPADVKALAPDVLRHRVALSYEAEADRVTPDAVIHRVLDRLPVP